MRGLLGIIICGLFLGACTSSVQNVTTAKVDGVSLVVVDEEKVTKKKTVKLSELVEDFQIIRFENKDEAFFKSQWMYFSDNYICVRQTSNAIKLFDKSGKYLGNVGNVGQGPGEYRAVYDILLNEKGQNIYVMPIVGDDILYYDLTGKYLDKITLVDNINKGRLFLSPDASVLSLVHLCFKDDEGKFTGANIQLHKPDSIQYVYVEELVSKMIGEDGKRRGFDDEIWSYRSADKFPFMITHHDTLYHYDGQTNKIQAAFSMSMDSEKKGESFFIFNEWPHYYFITIVGGKRNIIVDKEDSVAYEVKFVNDFMGNMSFFPSIQDGYFFQNWEPGVLKETLKELVASEDCPEEQKGKLKNFMQTLNENDNNVLFLGKLKQ